MPYDESAIIDAVIETTKLTKGLCAQCSQQVDVKILENQKAYIVLVQPHICGRTDKPTED